MADRLAALVPALLGGPLRLRLRAWDGSEAGPPDAPATVVIRRRRALRRLLWAPDELGLSRAYVAGDIDVEGDLAAVFDQPESLAVNRPVGFRRADRVRAVQTIARLGGLGLPPRPPAEESRLSGRRHTRRRDAAAIAHHYDVGNAFYRLLLGETLTYSCAYFAEPSYSLDQAQLAKCELISRKLGLRPGMRFLDVGCGWGTLALHAARVHGVQAVGITLSEQQATLARERVAEAGLADRVEIRLQDYRDVDDGPYDAIASVGMAEHVGSARLADYVGVLFRLLTPQGRVLNHQITRAHDPGGVDRTSFINRYVFPDGELLPVGRIVTALEEGGLEVRDVEGLREHYARTLRAWSANLDARWEDAVRLSTPGRARVWRLYMAGAALAFDAGRIGIHQILAVRPGPTGASGLPATRADWLVAGSPS